jgi:hypothetical protein
MMDRVDETKLLPRFTIRTLLIILTFCAGVFLILGAALRGHSWAWGVSIGIFSLVVTAVVHAAWFGIASLFARTLTPSQVSARSTQPTAIAAGGTIATVATPGHTAANTVPAP